MTVQNAEAIARNYYGLNAKSKKLAGYEDENFLLTTATKEQYILKISNSSTSHATIKGQNHILNQLQTNKTVAACYPKVIPSLQNTLIVTIPPSTNNKQQVHVRLLSFLRGAFWGDIPKAAQSNSFFSNFGRFLATTNQALGALKIPAIQLQKSPWDLQHYALNKKYVSYISSPAQQTLLRYFFMQLDNEVAPKMQHFRKSIIHGDANDWNVLVDKKAETISGLIDFGDACYTQTINELAIALAYALMGHENPIEKAIPLIKAYHEVLPLLPEELDALYYLIAARLCTSVCGAAYNKTLRPDDAYITISEKPAWALLEKWISINPIYAENAFRNACKIPLNPRTAKAIMLEERFQHISKSMSVSYLKDAPIKMHKAALQYMYDEEGNTYLDGVNNICHVGHCHPQVVAAGQAQMAKLNTNTRYLYPSLNEYAAMLCATFPAPLNKVFFVNSGSAATDLAARLARTHTQRQHLLVVDHAYHGNTTVGIDLSPYKYEGKGGQGKANYIYKAPIPDTYRGKYKRHDTNAGKKYAAEVQQLLAQAQQNKQPIAAFFCESILGCGGQVLLPNDYLSHVYAHVRKAGGICVADEVQVGFGRVGSHFWAFELQNVIPDIVVLGKPIGNGHPLAAVVTTTAIAESFENGMEFFSSFGGNPVSCEIGKAVLEVIKKDKLQENALAVGNYLLAECHRLKEKHALIGDVRGAGLFLGIELVNNRITLIPAAKEAEAIVNLVRQAGIFLSTDGPYHNVIKFKPPLVFNKTNAQQLISILDKAFAHIHS